MNRALALSPRLAAFEILARAEKERVFASTLLAQTLSSTKVHSADKGLVTKLVKGVLEQQTLLDAELSKELPRGLESLGLRAKIILRLGLYQLRFLDRVAPELAVDLCVDLAKKHSPAHKGLTNAVLRKLAGKKPQKNKAKAKDSAQALAKRFSHPLWIIERWLKALSLEETTKLLEYNNAPWPVFMRVNTLRLSPAQLKSELSKEGLELSPGRYLPEAFIVHKIPPACPINQLESFKAGHFTVQDESSGLMAHILGPKPGEFIVDLCAAPGGKTTHLAQLMRNQGRILALDSSAQRLKALQENLERLGISIVEPLCLEAAKLKLSNLADAVLLDAPCSGLGVLGRKADLRWNKLESSLLKLQATQLKLLQAAAALLKPGGRLLYSTCSTEPEENEDVILQFLKSHQDFTLAPFPAIIPKDLVTAQGFLRTWPQRHGTAGMFGALLVKKNI